MLISTLPKIFIGRNEVLELLGKRVEALKAGYRQNVALTGQKLCGKTSILQHFLSDLKADMVIPVYIEVIIESLETFSKKFIGTMLFNFLKGSSQEIKEDLDFLISKAEGLMPKTTLAVKRVLSLLEKGDNQEAYSELFNLTAILKEETKKSCIIILDEFHNLASFDLKNPFAIFGKRIMVQKDTMYIVTSSQVSSIKKILKERLDLLFGNFEIVEIKDFDYDVSRLFLEKRLEKMRLQDGIRDFLISFTDGRPFYLDIITSELNNLAAQFQFELLTDSQLSQAFENLFFDSKGAINQYFQNLISSLSQQPDLNDYMDILSAISEGKRRLEEIRSSFSGRKKELVCRVERLIEENFISKNGVIHYFNDKVFKFWIRYVYNRKRYSLLSSFQDRSDLFKKEIGELISVFAAENKKEPSLRLKELLNSFDNETLRIGEKGIRLPRFTRAEIEGPVDEAGRFLIRADYGRGKFWIFQFNPLYVEEGEMSVFIERFKRSAAQPQRKIFIAFSGIDTNAMLIAKENKVWVWEREDLNILLSLFNKSKMHK